MSRVNRYPLDDLAALAGVPVRALLGHRGSVSGSKTKEYLELGVTELVADRLACRWGFHPEVVWPQWMTDSIEREG